jgi:phage terminase Nu1 subunit (DNA packaging protein)
MQIKQKELAEILGVSARRIRQLTDEQGLFVKNAERRYDAAKCVKTYINYKLKARG